MDVNPSKYSNDVLEIPLYVYVLFKEKRTHTVAFRIGPTDRTGFCPVAPLEEDTQQERKDDGERADIGVFDREGVEKGDNCPPVAMKSNARIVFRITIFLW